MYLGENGINVESVGWPDEDSHPNALDLLRDHKDELVVNIPKDLSTSELYNDYAIRRGAVDYNIPLLTNGRLASAFLQAICRVSRENLKIKSWDEYANTED